MDDDKKPKPIEEAKGVAEKLVQTLGLVELILGALALYWFQLWYGTRVTALFPTTGYNFVDVALLACAAAFAGKAISVIATIFVAGVEHAIEEWNLKYYKKLTEVLPQYHKAQGHSYSLNQNEIDFIDMATRYIVTADPNQRAELEGIRTKSMLAYSMALLAFPYAGYLIREGAPGWITIGIGGGVVLFLMVGVSEQLFYIQTLSPRLIALHARQQNKRGETSKNEE